MIPVMLYRMLIATAVVGAGLFVSGEPEGELCWLVVALAYIIAAIDGESDDCGYSWIIDSRPFDASAEIIVNTVANLYDPVKLHSLAV